MHEQGWIEANYLNLKTHASQHLKATKVIRKFITNKVKCILHCKFTFDLRLDTSLSQKIDHTLFIKNSGLKEPANIHEARTGCNQIAATPPPLRASVYESDVKPHVCAFARVRVYGPLTCSKQI